MLKKRTLLTLIISFSAVCFLAACSDSPDTPTVDSGPSNVDQSILPKTEKGVTPPPTCDCDEDQVCNTESECVAKPAPTENDVVGEVVIKHLENENLEILVANGAVGKYKSSFWDKSDGPSWDDPRTSFTTPEGFLCYHDESSCAYPGCNNDNVWIPKGLSAGDLTFTVESAPGPVVFEAWESLSIGWQYKLKEGEPGPIKDGNTTHASFFESKYVPLGAPMTMAMAGGDDLDAATYENLAMAQRLVLTAPTPGVEPSADEDLKITWDSTQGGTTINIELVSGDAMVGTPAKISCSFRDSGSITIPKAELAKMHQGRIYMSIQRDATRYVKTQTKDGRDAHLMLTGRFEVQHYFYEY